MTEPDTAVEEREHKVRAAQTRYSVSPAALLAKVVLLGLLDALVVFAASILFAHGQWLGLVLVLVAALILNAIYIPPNRMLPAKYLAPGVVFLLIFQVFVIAYSVAIAFTNYGDSHMGSKDDAIVAIQRNNQDRVEDSPTYPATFLRDSSGALAMATVDPTSNEPQVGTASSPLAPRPDASVLGDRVTQVPGYTVMSDSDIMGHQLEVTELAVPRSGDPTDGSLRSPDGMNAYLYVSRYHYDKGADTFTDTKGTTFSDTGEGAYVASDGTRLEPGWMIGVGGKNFSDALTDPQIRGPLVQVTIWTFVFAILSVALSFVVGLGLALMLNDPRVRFRRLYRTLLILPYAFPAFLGILIWSGLMNQSFGFLNQVIFHHPIAWLSDPWIAKLSVLIVNTWLGYPYMFLVCTGALQSIPEEVTEAARVDGASPWETFRQIKFPLLMVPLAPLLISSFAFNFNNFSLIYFLTRGGPRFGTTGLDAGATDILISLVYKVANGEQGHHYGLASAFSIIIFVVVGLLSYLGFRQTRALEDIN